MDGLGEKQHHDTRASPNPPSELTIADLAYRQHGVVALWQLREVGLSAGAARQRVNDHRWRRVHVGVYAAGHAPLTVRARYAAAVLACGPDAALSHRSAADLRSLRDSARFAIDVSSPTRRGRGRHGIDAHRGESLLARDVERVDAIPCTSVARTLLDLAEVINRRALERACERAEILRVFDLRAVDDVLARAAGRPGAARLADVVARLRPGDTLTKSDLEERFLALCRATDLPLPEINAWIALEPLGVEADALFRAARVDVELDGRDVHMTPDAFERDRLRDQRLQVAGWRVLRFTGRQLKDDPLRVAATVRALVAAGAPTAGG